MLKEKRTMDISYCGSNFACMVNANKYKVLLSCHLHPVMKPFYFDRSALFQDIPVHIHSEQRLPELINKYENHAYHMLWPSQPLI